jgi:SPP1 family predicted phage head-tail adaptor
MTAGKYRHRIEFLAKAQKQGAGGAQDEFGEIQDEYGEPTGEWKAVIKCWGLVHYLAGRELWAAKQANSEVSGRVELRYRDDITPDMRIKYRDRIMDIEAIIPMERERQELHIAFKELI